MLAHTVMNGILIFSFGFSYVLPTALLHSRGFIYRESNILLSMDKGPYFPLALRMVAKDENEEKNIKAKIQQDHK